MAVTIDEDDSIWKLQDMPDSVYEVGNQPATIDIKAVELAPDMNKEIESTTTSNAWEATATSSELEPTTTWNEAEAGETSNWRDTFQGLEISNIDDKPTPTTSTDVEYQDQQMTGILGTVPGIINEETSVASSSSLSTFPAVETEMPASSALLEEISNNTPSSTTDSIIEAAYTEPANVAYEAPTLPTASMIIDHFESESTSSTDIYNEPQEAPIAMNAFSSSTSAFAEETQVPQPSIKLHIPDGNVQKSNGPANATPQPSIRILPAFPGNTDNRNVAGQANPPPAPPPAADKSPDPKDAKASPPPPAGKPSASTPPSNDPAKPSNSPATGNPPKESNNGSSPPAGTEHIPNSPGGGPSSSSSPSRPSSPPGGGTPGGSRGGPGVGDYGGPFSGGQGKSGSSGGKTTDEDLGAIGQIGVFESSGASQHLALGSIWMWIVALVVIWTTLKHRN